MTATDIVLLDVASDWSVNRMAAQTVCRMACDVAEARTLLELLGIVEPGGRELLPHDTAVYTLSDVGKAPGGKTANPSTPLAFADHGRRPEGMTTPPGLANLPPLPEPASRPARKKTTPKRTATTRTPRTPRQSKPTRTPRVLQPCGTVTAYRRHKNRGEDPCAPCTDAAREHWRAVDRARGIQPRKTPVAECGTRSGYAKHRRDGTPTCQPCREANNYRVQENRRGGRKARCGTRSGYLAHRRRHEDACAPCKDACNAYQRQRTAEKKQAAELARLLQADVNEATVAVLAARVEVAT